MYQTPLCNGHYFEVLMVSAIERFHSGHLQHSSPTCSNFLLTRRTHLNIGVFTRSARMSTCCICLPILITCLPIRLLLIEFTVLSFYN